MTCTLLTLPLEIRDQILGEVFFPGESEPASFDQDKLGLAPTAVRQIFPYDRDTKRKPRFQVNVIRTCKQLQHEAEAVLYGSSSWNLMYQDWTGRVKLSYEFLQKFPRRLRALIQRVERKAYSVKYHATISLFDWTLFMTFLARECPNLHSLKLWGPGDRSEAPSWIESCKRHEPWIKAILQIKTLKYFDIHVIKNGAIYDYSSFKDHFLPWLKKSLTHQQDNTDFSYSRLLDAPGHHFKFLELPSKVRTQIYRETVLPSNRRVHPFIKSWYDETTRNLVPLYLTCKQIRQEVEDLFYNEAVFTSPITKYDTQLLDFLGYGGKVHPKSSTPRSELVRHVRIGEVIKMGKGHLAFIAQDLKLQSLEFGLSKAEIESINENFLAMGGSATYQIARVTQASNTESIKFDAYEDLELLPPICDLWRLGFRSDLLFPEFDFDGGVRWVTATERNPFRFVNEFGEDSDSNDGDNPRFVWLNQP